MGAREPPGARYSFSGARPAPRARRPPAPPPRPRPPPRPGRGEAPSRSVEPCLPAPACRLVLSARATDGVVDDAAMIRVVEALLDQALRRGNREIGDFLAKLLAGAAYILLHLLARARHEPRGLGLGGLDQSSLLIRGVLEGFGPDLLGLGMRGLDLGRVLRALLLGLR